MTSVQTKSNDRTMSTIPKRRVAENVPLDGTESVSWHIKSRDRVSLQIEDDDTDRPTTRVYHDEASGSFSVEIPRHIAHAMHMVGGEVEWSLRHGNPTLTVASRSSGGEDDE